MSEFVVRAAVPEDSQQMAEVMAAGREQTYGLHPLSWDYQELITGYRGEAGARTMTNYMNASGEWDFIGARPRAMVVTEANSSDVVGVLLTREHEVDGEPIVHLDYLFVDPPMQGKGLGHLLMNNLTKYAGGKRQELTVVTTNERARRLYEKYGFVAVEGAVEGYPLQFQKMVKPASASGLISK